jgi:hypothetical protein
MALKRPRRTLMGIFKLAGESKSIIRSLLALRGLDMEGDHVPTMMGPGTLATRPLLLFSCVALTR